MREVKVSVSPARLAIAARTKAPFCGVQWAERARPLVVPTKFLRAAMSHPGAKQCKAYIVSNGSPDNPLELVISGKGFHWTLKHQARTVWQLEAMREWAAGMRKRRVLATPELRMDAKRQRQLRNAQERLRIETKRHAVGKPRHPLADRGRQVSAYRQREDREWWNERIRIERRCKDMQRTCGWIVARFLQERGRHWQKELKAALAERGLEIRTGYSRLKKLQAGRWIAAEYGADVETYLKHVWRDVKGMEHSYYWDKPGVDLSEACREWRNVDLLKYLEWKQRERMLLQDIADVTSGLHVEDVQEDEGKDATKAEG